MRLEIKSASSFLSSLLRLGNSLKIEQLELFRTQMEDLLRHHYQHHWFPDKPCKGSGYRCIRINHKMDPLISKAGSACGLDEASLRQLFPNELTLWIDPREVSYRIGENGSICVLFDGNKSQVSDIDDLQDYNGETHVSGPMYGQQQQQLQHRQHPQPHHQHHQQQHPQQHHNQLNQVYHHHHQQHHHNQVDRYNRPSCKESMRNQNSWDCFIMDPRNMNFEHLAAYVSS